jgi:hypothetical protein
LQGKQCRFPALAGDVRITQQLPRFDIIRVKPDGFLPLLHSRRAVTGLHELLGRVHALLHWSGA